MFEASKHDFKWFQRKWLEAWQYTASKLMKLRTGYKTFYVTPEKLIMLTNFDMTDKEFIELISAATYYFNCYLGFNSLHVLTGYKEYTEFDIYAHTKSTYDTYKEALTTYYTELNSKQLSMSLLSDAFEVKPEFMYGMYFENEKWIPNTYDIHTDISSTAPTGSVNRLYHQKASRHNNTGDKLWTSKTDRAVDPGLDPGADD